LDEMDWGDGLYGMVIDYGHLCMRGDVEGDGMN